MLAGILLTAVLSRTAIADPEASEVHPVKPLSVDLEAGGGLGIFEVPGAELATHGFVGVRAGWQMTKRRARASRTFEVEMQFRALAVEHGVGFSGGMGFWWGD